MFIISPVLLVGPEAPNAQLNWTDSLGQLSSVVGAAYWYLATKLDFEFELLEHASIDAGPLCRRKWPDQRTAGNVSERRRRICWSA
jgi:hypothetical protein